MLTLYSLNRGQVQVDMYKNSSSLHCLDSQKKIEFLESNIMQVQNVIRRTHNHSYRARRGFVFRMNIGMDLITEKKTAAPNYMDFRQQKGLNLTSLT